jgi:hypothetical protein
MAREKTRHSKSGPCSSAIDSKSEEGEPAGLPIGFVVSDGVNVRLLDMGARPYRLFDI